MEKLILVGHACLDEVIIEGKRFDLRVGGAVSYGASAASALGYRPLLISRVGKDFTEKHMKFLEKYADLSGVERSNMPSTRFGLIYSGGKRVVKLLARCDDISSKQLEKYITDDAMVHYGLLIREVSKENIERFRGAISSLDMQGDMRRADEKGNVFLERRPLPDVDVIHGEIYEAMLAAGASTIRDAIAFFEKRDGTSLITLDNGGAIVVYNHLSYYVPPATPRKVVDETGAGDAFSMAFLIELMSEGEPKWCAAIATSVASYLIETEGVVINASHKEIEMRAEKIYNRIIQF